MEIGKEELNCGLLAQMHNVNATMFDRYGDADDFLHSVVLAAFTRSMILPSNSGHAAK